MCVFAMSVQRRLRQVISNMMHIDVRLYEGDQAHREGIWQGNLIISDKETRETLVQMSTTVIVPSGFPLLATQVSLSIAQAVAAAGGGHPV